MEFQKIGLGATADIYRYNEKNISESAIDKECELGYLNNLFSFLNKINLIK